MLYLAYPRQHPNIRSQFETWDGIVVKVTPALAWAKGQRIEQVTAVLRKNDIIWKLAPECMRAPNLQSCYVKTDGPSPTPPAKIQTQKATYIAA